MERVAPDNCFLYGPVPSRRLGRSLGVDVVPDKVCSFDCVYCQLGRTTNLTSTPLDLVRPGAVLPEIERWLEKGGSADYITFSGSGEPTLNAGLGEMVARVKQLTDIPVAVITNGSLLSVAAVQDAVAGADLIVPSLDAGTEETFQLVNRPAPGLYLRQILDGLQWLTDAFRGSVWIEVMLVRGYNDSLEELQAIRGLLQGVRADRIQVITVERPSASEDVEALDEAALKTACTVLGLGATSVSLSNWDQGPLGAAEDSMQAIVDLLARRPCTARDIASITGIHHHDILKRLGALLGAGKIERVPSKGTYFRSRTPAGKDAT